MVRIIQINIRSATYPILRIVQKFNGGKIRPMASNSSKFSILIFTS